MILGVVIAVLLFVRQLLVGAEHDTEPMPECMTCGARFLDGRGVDWHRSACHPHVDPLEHDDGSISRWNR